jgi:leucyl/phenylalanyl-tRNA--protein transferase
MSKRSDASQITPEVLLRAYALGLFPMAEDRDSKTLFWVEPRARGIFDLDGLIVSHSLAKAVRSDRFEICVNRDFDGVLEGCAARAATWINAEIRRLYAELHAIGHAHSIEAYADGALVGGLYGVSLRGAFFGESMFHSARDASKVALVHLVARLRLGAFTLLDTQFLTPHLASLGAFEISRQDYLARLASALQGQGDAGAFAAPPMSGDQALRLVRGPSAR